MMSRMTIKLQRSPSISSVRLIGHLDLCTPFTCCTLALTAVVLLVQCKQSSYYSSGCNMQADRQRCVQDDGFSRLNDGGFVSKLKVSAFSMSIDGYSAGPRQSLENPLGVGGLALHEWAFGTRTFQRMFGNDAGATGIDDD